jgi:hypothetical protein
MRDQICGEEVWERPNYWHWHPCRRRGRVEIVHRDGGHLCLCWQHAEGRLRRGNGAWKLVAAKSEIADDWGGLGEHRTRK